MSVLDAALPVVDALAGLVWERWGHAGLHELKHQRDPNRIVSFSEVTSGYRPPYVEEIRELRVAWGDGHPVRDGSVPDLRSDAEAARVRSAFEGVSSDLGGY